MAITRRLRLTRLFFEADRFTKPSVRHAMTRRTYIYLKIRRGWMACFENRLSRVARLRQTMDCGT